jgi:hypothetical protein
MRSEPSRPTVNPGNKLLAVREQGLFRVLGYNAQEWRIGTVTVFADNHVLAQIVVLFVSEEFGCKQELSI